MKTAYEAANAIEAHMLRDVLRQEGIAAHVLGEHLLGALGELPAAGLVRLMVDVEDFARARAVLEEWDQAQPAAAPDAAPSAGPDAAAASAWRRGLLLGFALGAGVAWAWLRGG